MNWRRTVLGLLAHHLPPGEWMALASEVAPRALMRVPREERVSFGCAMAEAIVPVAVRDLSRKERAQFMNALLPLLAREFPLADLDFLAAFPTPVASEDAMEGWADLDSRS